MATVSRWADESPEVMRRLVTDPELQQQRLRALEEVMGDGDAPSEQVAKSG